MFKKIEELFVLVHNSWSGAYPFEEFSCQHLTIGLDREACRKFARESDYDSSELEIERWAISHELGTVVFQGKEKL